jgi:hypothetical protein
MTSCEGEAGDDHMRHGFGLGTVAAAVMALGLGLAAPLHFQTATKPAVVRPDETAVVRLGPTGGRLSVADLDQIAQVTSGSIGDNWVVAARSPTMVSGARWFVTMFGLPNRQTALVRRGPTITVIAPLTTPTSYEDQKTWGVTGSVGEYAQVPVPGSDPRIVRDGRDLNRPFRVVGEVTDETLAAVVALVRTSPTIPPPLSAKGQPVASIFTTVRGSWPISTVVARSSSVIEVSLLDEKPNEMSGQKIVLHGSGRVWSVDRLLAWIAD